MAKIGIGGVLDAKRKTVRYARVRGSKVGAIGKAQQDRFYAALHSASKYESPRRQVRFVDQLDKQFKESSRAQREAMIQALERYTKPGGGTASELAVRALQGKGQVVNIVREGRAVYGSYRWTGDAYGISPRRSTRVERVAKLRTLKEPTAKYSVTPKGSGSTGRQSRVTGAVTRLAGRGTKTPAGKGDVRPAIPFLKKPSASRTVQPGRKLAAQISAARGSSASSRAVVVRRAPAKSGDVLLGRERVSSAGAREYGQLTRGQQGQVSAQFRSGLGRLSGNPRDYTYEIGLGGDVLSRKRRGG